MSTQRGAYRAGKAGYVSEFMQFMESLLMLHPEIVRDQHRGWARYWEPQVDLVELQKAREDSVSIDDHLGTISRSD